MYHQLAYSITLHIKNISYILIYSIKTYIFLIVRYDNISFHILKLCQLFFKNAHDKYEHNLI